MGADAAATTDANTDATAAPPSAPEPIKRASTAPPGKRNPAAARPGWKKSVDSMAEKGTTGNSAMRFRAVVASEATRSFNSLNEYDKAIRRSTFAASFGGSRRELEVKDSCPTHSYLGMASTLKKTGVASFGDGPGHSDTSNSTNCPVHVYQGHGSSLRKRGVASFGNAPGHDDAQLKTACSVHAYYTGRPFTPATGGVSFGKGKTGRENAPKTNCSVHSYDVRPSTPGPPGSRRQSGVGTFGTSERSFGASMTKTGLVISSRPPSALRPLTPTGKMRATKSAVSAVAAMNKLSKSASSPAVGSFKKQQKFKPVAEVDKLIIDTERSPPDSPKTKSEERSSSPVKRKLAMAPA
jgi:hypothetical protein